MTFDIVTIWHFVLTIWHLTMWKFAIWQFDIVDIWHCWHLPLLTSDIVDIWHWQAISQWLMDQPPLSIKHQDQLARLEGRLALCPSCPGLHRAPSPMSSRHAILILISNYVFCRHVFLECPAIESVRKQEGIRSFLDACSNAGLSSVASVRYYISGLDTKGVKIPVKDHLSRGRSLINITEGWLSIWEPMDWETICIVSCIL